MDKIAAIADLFVCRSVPHNTDTKDDFICVLCYMTFAPCRSLSLILFISAYGIHLSSRADLKTN